MSTTYVLHGGGTKTDSPENDGFYKTFTSLVPKDEVKILLCYWARAKDKLQEMIMRDEPRILRNTNKKVSFTIASDDAAEFYKQLADSDVLYVAGGEAEFLEPYYKHMDKLEKALEGKIYLGSSMGAFMVSKNYVLSLGDQDTAGVHKGLGILPINTLCHWNVETEKERKINLLQDADPDTPALLLDEGRYAVFVK